MTASPNDAAPPGTRARLRRLEAVLLDSAALLAALGGALLLALAWLLLRTGFGRRDVGDGDGVIAAAMLAAAPAAWVAWLLQAMLQGATPGERRAGLRLVARTARARVLRLALHPLSLPLWLWLALLLLAAGTRWLALLPLAAAGGIGLLAVASTVLWAVAPASPALHDRLARTRLEAWP